MDIHSDPTSIAIQMTHFEKIMLFNQPIWFSAMTMWLSYESHTSYKKKNTFFSNLIYNHIKNNGWKNELFKKKKRLKILSISLTFVLLPIACAKKKFSKHTGANREIKKKKQQISVMRNQ